MRSQPNWPSGFGLLFVHVAALLVLWPAFFNWWALAVAAVLAYATGAIGITLCYHRTLTHRSLRMVKPLEYATALLGALAFQGGPIQWVATHRVHHAHSDRDGDPHSVHLAHLEAAQGTTLEEPALWESLWELRQEVQKALEPFRAQKKASLDAAVTLKAPSLEPLGVRQPERWLETLLIVSQVTLADGPIQVADAQGFACERCWRWSSTQGLDERCRAVLAGSHSH